MTPPLALGVLANALSLAAAGTIGADVDVVGFLAWDRGAVGRWLDQGARRAALRVFAVILGFIAIIFICLGLVCAWWMKELGPEFHVEEARAVSPNLEWTAVAYRYGYHSWGQEGRHHIVRISRNGGPPDRGSKVWNSDEVPVASLQWKGNDSILVNVRIQDDEYVRWLLTTMKTHRSHGVAARTVVTLTPKPPPYEPGP